MADWTIPQSAQDYRLGRMSRRAFIGRMLAAGLTAPLIAAVLAACGSSNNAKKPAASTGGAGSAATRPAGAAGSATASAAAGEGFNPSKRGGGGTIKLLWWQAPTILNIHLSSGVKDNDASTLFTEPLAYWGPDAAMVPVLAAEIPSLDNGGVAKDGTSVTWKLKQGVQWHDGQPFTADDVVFTWQYIADPATAATSSGNYANIASVDRIDDQTVKITWKEPTPYWQTAFVSSGHILPKHILEPYKGAQARNAPFNLKPVGTGPYKLAAFTPGDNVSADLNPNYHVPNRPYFDHVQLKGGGDAVSAARAVLQTGDYDYAWNLQVADDQLLAMEKAGTGHVVITPGFATEYLLLNESDPNATVDGERSSIMSKHPFFSDVNVRKAFAVAVDRTTISDQLYGRQGSPAIWLVSNPSRFVPSGGSFTFDLQKAAQMLDAAGWTKGSDGIRQKDGKKMHVLYQTTVNDVRQNTQAIVKKNLESIGVQVDLKTIDAGIYFSSDAGNPDTANHFYADMEMHASTFSPDPQNFFRGYVSSISGNGPDDIPQKANSWSKSDTTRYQNPAYDSLWRQARTELDPVKRADLFKQMQQIIVNDAVVVPLVNRNSVGAAKSTLLGLNLSVWDSDLYELAYWHRKA
jgi:peptide/nickel transport system substrate-binding protein